MLIRPVLFLVLVCLPWTVAAQEPTPAAAPPPAFAPTLRFNGYVQFDFLAPLGGEARTPDAFRFRRVRLQGSGDLIEKVSWSVTIEATTTPVLRDAYVALRYVPGATVRVGQLVLPYGMEQYLFSSNSLEFTERVTTEVLASRDAGVVVSNDEPFFGWLSYAAAVTNGTRQNNPDNNSAKDGVFRLGATPRRVPGLQVGGSVMRGEQPDGVRTRAGADLSFERRLLHLAAEYSREQNGEDAEKRVGYVFGAWRIYPPRPLRGLHHVEIGARRTRSRNLSTPINQWDLSANYYITPTLRFLCDLILRTDPEEGVARRTFHARANFRF